MLKEAVFFLSVAAHLMPAPLVPALNILCGFETAREMDSVEGFYGVMFVTFGHHHCVLKSSLLKSSL
jgi:hypothetical protein